MVARCLVRVVLILGMASICVEPNLPVNGNGRTESTGLAREAATRGDRGGIGQVCERFHAVSHIVGRPTFGPRDCVLRYQIRDNGGIRHGGSTKISERYANLSHWGPSTLSVTMWIY